MLRDFGANLLGGLLGLLAALLLLGLTLGTEIRQHEPGLWTLRFQRILDCGLDYNGPPFTNGSVTVWLTCGGEDSGWRVWPPGRER